MCVCVCFTLRSGNGSWCAGLPLPALLIDSFCVRSRPSAEKEGRKERKKTLLILNGQWYFCRSARLLVVPSRFVVLRNDNNTRVGLCPPGRSNGCDEADVVHHACYTNCFTPLPRFPLCCELGGKEKT